MISEEMLRLAAARSCEIYAVRLESGYDSADVHQFSEKFERKIKKLNRKADHPIFYRALRYVASVALAILVAGSAWLTIDVEARKEFFGWVQGVYATYFVYHFEGEKVPTSPTDYRPTLIPEGYTEISCDEDTETVFVLYANASGQLMSFLYAVNPSDTTWFIDRENTITKPVSVHGNAGTLFVSTDEETSSGIIWSTEDDTAFFLTAFLDEEELLRVAESVSPVQP